MNIPQRAALDVAKLVLFGAVIGVGTSLLIEWLGLAVVGALIAVVAMVMLVKTAWRIRVGQLESEQDRILKALKDE
jgi:hypothetical protein